MHYYAHAPQYRVIKKKKHLQRASVYNKIYYKLLGALVTLAFYNSNYVVDRQIAPFPNIDSKVRNVEKDEEEGGSQQPWKGGYGDEELRV